MSKKPRTSIDMNNNKAKYPTAVDDDDDDDVEIVEDDTIIQDCEEDSGAEEPNTGTTDTEMAADRSDHMPVFLTDPRLLDCPICFEPLAPPVYQCPNGHLSCESCCTKMSDICAACSMPIRRDNRCRAMEQMLESFRFSCMNAEHGCKTFLTYINKLDHEKTCGYAPCHCPVLDCTYVALPNSVYTHFAAQHSSKYSLKFRFNSKICTSLGKDQTHIFLQESGDQGEIFIVNRSIKDFGSIVNVLCVAPASSKNEFSYDLTAFDWRSKSQVILKSAVDNSPQFMTENTPKSNYVIVPDYCLTSSKKLDLGITIRKGPVKVSGWRRYAFV